jgi:hypothetical protein
MFFPTSAYLTLEDDGRYASEDSEISVGQGMKDNPTTKVETSDSEIKLVT